MEQLVPWVREQTHDVLERARRNSESLVERSRKHLEVQLDELGLAPRSVCIIAAGSIGRREALAASDLDLLVVTDDDAIFERLRSTNDELGGATRANTYELLRANLSAALDGIDVSKGRTVMGPVKLTDLADLRKIGGDDDDRKALTRRTLVLTEAVQLGGELPLREIRERILDAYIRRTDGAHPLAFCNDVARYYRQVCIDYKAKHGAHETDWAESNVKLRHARKLWYFSTALAIAATDVRSRSTQREVLESLLETLERTPCQRLLDAAGPAGEATAEILDRYAMYLDRMSKGEIRQHLRGIVHEHRDGDPVYAALQENSRRLHVAMLRLLEQLQPEVREKVLDWFLL